MTAALTLFPSIHVSWVLGPLLESIVRWPGTSAVSLHEVVNSLQGSGKKLQLRYENDPSPSGNFAV